LTDKNECLLPDKNEKVLLQEFESQEPIERDPWVKLLIFKGQFLKKKNASFINCWIMNKHESYALWKNYLSGGKTGVAIKTNVNKLIKSINICKNDEEIFLGKIQYTNFIKGNIEFYKLITSKRIYYNYENELRLIIFSEPEFEFLDTSKQILKSGLRINIDPKILIDEIFISPFGGRTFIKVFKQTIKQVAPYYSSKIRTSNILDS
jgi:hypothetical protein